MRDLLNIMENVEVSEIDKRKTDFAYPSASTKVNSRISSSPSFERFAAKDISDAISFFSDVGFNVSGPELSDDDEGQYILSKKVNYPGQKNTNRKSLFKTHWAYVIKIEDDFISDDAVWWTIYDDNKEIASGRATNNNLLSDITSDEDLKSKHPFIFKGQQIKDSKMSKNVEEGAEKIACLGCDAVSTKAAWTKNNNFCPKCKKSNKGVAESVNVNETKSNTYSCQIDDNEYQQLRKASMRGKFDHKFSRDEQGNVTFSTKSPQKLVKDLDSIIDPGEESWSEILNIAQEPAMEDIERLKKLSGLSENYGMGMEAPQEMVNYSQTKTDGDSTVTVSANAKDMEELHRVLKLAGINIDNSAEAEPEVDVVAPEPVEPELDPPCGCGDPEPEQDDGMGQRYSTNKQALVDMIRQKMQARFQ